MPRSRTVKPGFFKSPDIQRRSLACRLLFIALWTQADRDGLLEDRPDKIRIEAFPYDVDISDQEVDDMLEVLHDHALITRYVCDSVPLIEVVTWRKHQHPHPREADSELPKPPANARQQKRERLGNAKDMTSPSSTSNTSEPSSTSYTSEPSTLRASHTSSRELFSVAGTEEKAPARKAARLADDWHLPLAWGEWAVTEFGWMREQVLDQAERFADYWHGKGTKDAAKLDWFATWRNWCRKARDLGDIRNANGMQRSAARQHTARVLTGYDPSKPAEREVIDLPPDDAHVIDTKH